MFEYPKTFAELEKQVNDGLYVEKGEEFMTAVQHLLYLIDASTKSDKNAGRQYLWHMAKFFRFTESNDGKPVLIAKLRFRTVDIYCVIFHIEDAVDTNYWGYGLRYFFGESKTPMSKEDAKQGYLWNNRFNEVKLQDILRTNYIRFKKAYGAY